jgi:hypothetical protein
MTENDQLTKEKNDKRLLIATSLASPLASVVAKFVTYPIDTVKTKVQADRINLHRLSDYKVGHSLRLSKTNSMQLNRSTNCKGLRVSFLESPSLLLAQS